MNEGVISVDRQTDRQQWARRNDSPGPARNKDGFYSEKYASKLTLVAYSAYQVKTVFLARFVLNGL